MKELKRELTRRGGRTGFREFVPSDQEFIGTKWHPLSFLGL